MVKKEIPVKGSRILMMGITFKENCPDIRNTRAIDIYHELKTYHLEVEVYDPWANPQEVWHEYAISSISQKPAEKFDAVILAVAHKQFEGEDIRDLCKSNAVIYDVKAILPKEWVDARL